LQDTALIADHVGSDRTLLIELALRGRFAVVPDVLFFNRDHPDRFTRQLKSMQAQAKWFAPNQPVPKFLRTWTLYTTSRSWWQTAEGARELRRRIFGTDREVEDEDGIDRHGHQHAGRQSAADRVDLRHRRAQARDLPARP
jgi:hypothetical protein